MKGLRQAYLSKVKQGRMSVWKGEGENVVSGKQMDSVQEETLAVSAMGIIVVKKHNRPLLLQRREHRLTGEDFRKAVAPGRKSFWEDGSKKTCKSYLKRNCTNPSCNYWHPPVCQITHLIRDANSTCVCSDIPRLTGSQVKSRRQVVARISCHI